MTVEMCCRILAYGIVFSFAVFQIDATRIERKINKITEMVKKSEKSRCNVKHGEWIKVTNGRGGHECSLCGNYALNYQSGAENLSDFCPYCGADMVERKETE